MSMSRDSRAKASLEENRSAITLPEDMTPEEARERFSKIVDQESKELVAARLGCSVQHVINIKKGPANDGQDPGLRTACAIEETYRISMRSWVHRPAAKRIA